MKKITILLLIIPLLFISCSKDAEDLPPDIVLEGVTVGVNGGEVTSEDGIVKLIIPSGALNSDTQINIEKVNVSSPVSQGVTSIGDTYKFSPSGLVFNSPIEVKLNYSSLMLPNGLESIAGVHWDNNNEYEIVGIDEYNNSEITFKISSFSYFSLSDFYDRIFESYGDKQWRNFRWKWVIPEIKWYVDDNIPNSILTNENIEYALNLWERETSSFIFETQVNTADEANIIFKEFYSSEEVIKSKTFLCDWNFLALNIDTIGAMCPNMLINPLFTNLEVDDSFDIFIASDIFPWSPSNKFSS